MCENRTWIRFVRDGDEENTSLVRNRTSVQPVEGHSNKDSNDGNNSEHMKRKRSRNGETLGTVDGNSASYSGVAEFEYQARGQLP
jgi:hypothetical protein